MKATIRRIYLNVVPEVVRRQLRRLPLIASLRKNLQSDTSMHDEYYTDEYYERDVAGPALQAAETIARAIKDQFAPTSIMDVGCGSGELLQAFQALGMESSGVDLAEAALKRCRNKGLDVAKHDLTDANPLPRAVDVVFSAEVAEHLPPSAAASFVHKLSQAARQHIVFTAANVDQDGLNHLNCQPKSYWIELFGQEGFAYDAALTDRWQTENREARVTGWFCHNLMVFHRE